MTETAATPVEQPRRFHFDWIGPFLLHPRRVFEKISARTESVWLTPILILMAATLLRVVVAGAVKQAAALSGQMNLPPDFQYYTPEQQAQFQQALQATSGPVFTYVLPAIIAILAVWVGWLLVGGLMHLALTLFGGRGATPTTMSLVAWASLPFALRDVIRAVYMLAAQRLIQSPGLSGFVPQGGRLNALLAAFLSQVDIYVVWHAALLIIGVGAGYGLTRGKAWASVLITLGVVVLFQALLGFAGSQLGNLEFTRPFLF